MDIEEAFREAAARADELPGEAVAWLDEIALDLYRGTDSPDAADLVKAICRTAFVAGQVYQQQFRNPADLPLSTEQKFELVKDFINFIETE